MIINKMTDLIGNTPIIKLDETVHGLKNIDLYAKLEYLNPFGSLKDRTAYMMIKDNIEQIKQEGLTVIETSSGNTAKALQCICNINNISFTTVTNRIKISESKNILKFLGAKVKEVSKETNTVEEILEMMDENKDTYYHTTQYTNPNNVKAHYETGKEIYEDIGNVDYFISVLGTSGSSTGAASFLEEKNNNLIKIGVVTAKDSYIPGIRTSSEMQEVGIFKRANYNEIISVDSKSAKEAMKTLSNKFGILAGPSTGASFYATMNYLKDIDNTLTERKTAVFIVCDRLELYANYIKSNRFYKYHVLGNTYIVIDPTENIIKLDRNKISEICSKNYGIGADGIILGPIIKDDEYIFESYNQDGSIAQNAIFGAMIFSKYLKDKQIVKESTFDIKIGKEKMKISFEDEEATKANLRFTDIKVKKKVLIENNEFVFIDVGNENLVLECDNVSKELAIEIGEKINSLESFKEGINIELVKILDSENIQLEVYERGVGYTLSSGTSILAACFALKDVLDNNITVHMPGGICKVDIEKALIKSEVYKIYEGELE